MTVWLGLRDVRLLAEKGTLAAERPAFHAMVERVEADPRIADVFRRHWPKKQSSA